MPSFVVFHAIGCYWGTLNVFRTSVFPDTHQWPWTLFTLFLKLFKLLPKLFKLFLKLFKLFLKLFQLLPKLFKLFLKLLKLLPKLFKLFLKLFKLFLKLFKFFLKLFKLFLKLFKLFLKLFKLFLKLLPLFVELLKLLKSFPKSFLICFYHLFTLCPKLFHMVSITCSEAAPTSGGPSVHLILWYSICFFWTFPSSKTCFSTLLVTLGTANILVT